MRKVLSIFSAVFFLFSCSKNSDRFRQLSGEETGITFNNSILESDSFNILTYEFIYNGGGVAVADFDNNGLQDVYFTGNMVSNELYLNQGDLKFKNVTQEAGATGEGKWSSAVAVVDINSDGWQDIYICATAHPEANRRKNIFYINQGLNESGIPTFIDEAERFHVADTSHSTAVAFLDYDKDGDQDLFVAINKMTNGRTANVYRNTEDFSERVDKLYRNDWDSVAKHPVFVDVSKEAGIIHDGFSLGVNVTDINQDGWPDIFVTNDYLTTDLVYINMQNGVFENKASDYFKHTSYSAMGNDVVDINNDGLPDVIAVDMLPEDNFRRKTMLGPNNYTNYINNEKYNIQHQYIRNTLQLNQGKDPISGNPIFSEVSFLSGISSTDWSWTPLVADFDNDGFRDIIVTNGFPKDVTDRDFVDYYSQAGNYASKSFLMQFMPSVKIKNYAYRNTGGYIFEDVTDSWGIKEPSFSSGAAYADLDNDGDLDYVVNNINDRAFVFENLTENFKDSTHHWLKLKLAGPKNNPSGLGAKVKLFTTSGILYADHSTYRGYLSSMEPGLHFGLGSTKIIDSILVEWPTGKVDRLSAVKVNQVLTLDIARSTDPKHLNTELATPKIYKDVSSLFATFRHQESDFVDFNIQPLLFHKLSQYGPSIAVGDIDGNNLDDFYVSGSLGKQGTFFIQKQEGQFEESLLIDDKAEPMNDELGVLLFDVDQDGDLDLYSASGGYEYPMTDSTYQHHFYENVKGKFRRTENAIPDFSLSASCVRASDFDRDGDLDLFVGGRVLPYQYPKPVSSYLLRNDSKNGLIKFTDITKENAFGLLNVGMICDALWTDFDQDGWVDLVLAGEWMPIRFLKNEQGFLKDITAATGISDKLGWWNSISASDFDHDGDIDYAVGNVGLNTLMKVSEKEPVSIYAGDFDGNGAFDILPTLYFKDKTGVNQEYPFFGRLDVQKELIRVKRGFLKHADFGIATIHQVLTDEQLQNALTVKANYFSSSYVENKGSGKFEISPLPLDAQLAPLYGMISSDVNHDGHDDLICVGNDFGTEVAMGRYDALNGLVLLGDGRGKFLNISAIKSGFSVRGDAKGLVSLLNTSGHSYIIATQNRDELKVFEEVVQSKVLSLDKDVVSVKFILADGSSIMKEVYYGSSFLSQSSRKVRIPEKTIEIIVTMFSGIKKKLQI